VALFALPATQKVSMFSQQNPQFLLNNSVVGNFLLDGSLTGGVPMKKGDVLNISVAQPIEASQVAILPLKPFTWAEGNAPSAILEVKQSVDGKKYTSLCMITTIGYNTLQMGTFSKTKAKYFSVEIKSWLGWDSFIEFQLAEIEFLNTNERPFYEEQIAQLHAKTAYIRGNSKTTYQYSQDEKGIDTASILRPETKTLENGNIEVSLPKGDWDVYRVGYTTTKAVNAPATPEGEGLECDKLDTNALNYHFSQFPQKMIETAGDFTGNTFKFLLIDSWECGFQNWTKNLPEEFKKRRGYALEPYYPVLAGINVGSTAESEAFLHDFRRTLAEMLQAYYYGHFAKLCHKNKLEMHAEVIYGSGMYPPLDILKTNELADMPMFEFWSGHNGKTTTPEYTPRINPNLDLPMSAAFFYDKLLIGAEAYTAMAHYSETLFDLKPFGDQAYMTGINQFILHSYVHQPHNSVPGFTLGPFGSHFNRNNPSFVLGKGWSEYHARVQTVLQQGAMHTDILYYLGDQLPQALEDGNKNIAPKGYQAHVCNTDILMNKLVLKDKKLWYKGVGFSVIYLPKGIALYTESLKKLKSLAENGVIISGFKPIFVGGLLNLKTDKAEFEKTVASLWPSSGNTNGSVFVSNNLAEILTTNALGKDFDYKANDSVSLSYTHRIIDGQHVYFLANQTAKVQEAACSFRNQSKQVELWNPALGMRYKLNPVFVGKNTELPLTFQPYESFFIVFNEKEDTQISNYRDKILTMPLSIKKVNLSFDGTAAPASFQCDTLPDLRIATNPALKYFSGYIDYQITFDIKKEHADVASTFNISLGDFASTASLTLNGVDLGYAWIPNYSISTKASLKESNTLLVRVATTWRNRIIGDLTEYGSLKNLWTTQKSIKDYLDADKPLRVTGIKGPIVISN
jgi:hypothetical protein